MEPFKIIGISIQTTNKNNQAMQDVPNLWNTFLNQGVLEKIPNKSTSDIYSVYTDYEGDYLDPYTVILGCKVDSFEAIPKGMVSKQISGGEYIKHIAEGNIYDGIIFNAWQKIWDSNLDRAYTADFEVYGEKAIDPEKAEVEIFVAVK